MLLNLNVMCILALWFWYLCYYLVNYRLFTNTGELICLQTKGFLEYNKETRKIESFLCINTLVRPEDEARYLNEQKEKFTPYISELQNSSNTVRDGNLTLIKT